MALSGGMAQRLMVARAIMHRPQILFLDEPTAGLDPQSRIALWEIVEELHAEGETILLTTHYMEEADQLCDRVAIMDHGQILALDTPERLKQSTGAGTIVKVTADAADADRLGRHLVEASRGPRTSRSSTAWCCCRPAGPGCCRASSTPPSRSTSPSPTSRSATLAGDRLHQPHREGPARMTTVTATPGARAWHPAVWSSSRPARVAYRRRSSRSCSATCTCCSRAAAVHRPCGHAAAAADVRVHVRVPEDRPGRRRQGAARPRSPARSWPASSVWPSCSRGSSRWRSRSSRSSATPRRSRTACWPRCRPRPSACRRS